MTDPVWDVGVSKKQGKSMKTFTTREKDVLNTDSEYQLVISNTRHRAVFVKPMKLHESKLHFEIEDIINSVEPNNSYTIEFVFNCVRFWIAYNRFGDIEQNGIVLTPFMDGLLVEKETQRHYSDMKLRDEDVAAFATDLYFLIQDK